MSDAYRVRLRTVGDGPTALGQGGPFTLTVDRPVAAGGGGLGFSGGQLLYMAIAACWSNDLYREAATMGIELDRVEITVDGDFPARGSGSTSISVDVTVRSPAPEERIRELIAEVERVAEIPRAIRDATPIEVHASVERPA
ncbi:MAG TPA: OsmC family protein [Candidatus Limnocylindrales bacterium]|nr:OsmC family protein [Candidatus Limnocylindrales bacterium]